MMHHSWRRGCRRGLVAVAALGLLTVGIPASQGAGTATGLKNLSTPLIVVDQDTVTSTLNPQTVPGSPQGVADYMKDGVGYFTSVSGTTYGADVWGASRVVVTQGSTTYAGPVVAGVTWGDNLLDGSLAGGTTQPIPVEVTLYADQATTTAVSTAFGTTMQGYSMVPLEGSGQSQIFGTRGVATAMTPLVYTPNVDLAILTYDPTTHAYGHGVIVGMKGEVDASGDVVYAFDWGADYGLPVPSPGTYRLIFSVSRSPRVTLGSVVSATGSGGTCTAPPVSPFPNSVNKTCYLDVVLGNPSPSAVGKGDFSGDGHPDVLARDGSGNLWLYPGSGKSSWLPRMRVGIGWNGMTALVAPGDFTGDGHPDLLARDSLGNLWLYPGSGKSSWLSKVKVGTGWNGMNALVAPGDFTGDGHPDLQARDSSGNLWLYPGNGTGGWLAKSKVGTGWNGMTALVAPGDFNGDGHSDLLARDKLGNLWLYPGSGKSSWLARSKVGIGWNGMTALVGPGDFSGDGHVDLLARDDSGNLWLYPGSGKSSWLAKSKVGTGWSGMTALVS